MSRRTTVRLLAFLAVALLAVVAVVAVLQRHDSSTPSGPQPVGSYTALAGSAPEAVIGRRTSCGIVLTEDTEGIAHPTLPCGVRLFITFGGKTVLAQVVDRGPYRGGREFDVTPALARRLGLQGVQNVRWSYARGTQ
jgi:rare lipoprotein A (peptidoglycan hydrolase)